MLIGLNGCLKKDTQSFTCTASLPKVSVPASEIAAVEAYLSQKGITDAQKNEYGYYYKINAPGSGNAPDLCSRVTVFYKGTFTNGNIFDQTTSNPVSFPLNQVILGWQAGMQLIKPGGKIILYLPPSLGYGSQSAGSIPPNSVLIFEVQLVSVG